MIDCPFKPGSDNFSENRCILCRSTDKIGFSCRKRIRDRILLMRPETIGKHYTNFECDFFPWNFSSELVSIDGGIIPIEGVSPLSHDDCEYFEENQCRFFNVPISMRIGYMGGQILEVGPIPICEFCQADSSHRMILEKYFKTIQGEHSATLS